MFIELEKTAKKQNTYGMVNMKLLIKMLNNILVKITI